MAKLPKLKSEIGKARSCSACEKPWTPTTREQTANTTCSKICQYKVVGEKTKGKPRIKPGSIKLDYTGQRFGKLTVLKPSDNFEPNTPRKWDCICDCGGTASVRGTALKNGTSKSCGCVSLEKLKKGWALAKENSIVKGLQGSLSVKDFLKQRGLSTKVVRTRINKGWTIERALETPPDKDVTKRNRRSRVKGRLFEKQVAGIIRESFPGLDEEDVRTTKMHGTDIRLSKRAREMFPFSVECKNYTKMGGYDLRKALDQAEKLAYPDTAPCVAWREHGDKKDDIKVCLDIKYFIAYLMKSCGINKSYPQLIEHISKNFEPPKVEGPEEIDFNELAETVFKGLQEKVIVKEFGKIDDNTASDNPDDKAI